MARVPQECATCYNYDLNNQSSYARLMYWCKDLGGYKEPDDGRNCSHYLTNPKYSRYHITTAVMDVCGYNKNNETYQLIMSLRDDYMEHNEASVELLREYDIVGPKIAKCILDDENREQISLNLLKDYIIPTASFIRINAYQMAVEKYKSMVDMLKVKYNITYKSPEEMRKEIHIVRKSR